MWVGLLYESSLKRIKGFVLWDVFPRKPPNLMISGPCHWLAGPCHWLADYPPRAKHVLSSLFGWRTRRPYEGTKILVGNSYYHSMQVLTTCFSILRSLNFAQDVSRFVGGYLAKEWEVPGP